MDILFSPLFMGAFCISIFIAGLVFVGLLFKELT
ncbi:hypothetical protein W908_08520 [Candidatus Pseudothioglobus singularis PS1]|jgi:hypothetical protein|uniref:Uncharacterized protein n=1 Tax=Candidatus Pseudothioglobus singularis PS1 TaxID=1125411 RepID=A0A0M3T2G6_9GAMM|nr:hypothetical protein W908_08520 [Candidatus Pseudothioglobus singularis PS1]